MIFNFPSPYLRMSSFCWISLQIEEAAKLHTVGESLLFPAINDMVGVKFSDKSSKEVKAISLSNMCRIDKDFPLDRRSAEPELVKVTFRCCSWKNLLVYKVCVSCLFSYVT